MLSTRFATALVILSALSASAQRAPSRLERLLLPSRTATTQDYLRLGIETRLAMVKAATGERPTAVTLANAWRGRRAELTAMTPEAADLMVRVLLELSAGLDHAIFSREEYDTLVEGNAPTHVGNVYVSVGTWMGEVGMALSSNVTGFDEIMRVSGRNIAAWLDAFGPAERALAAQLRAIAADLGNPDLKRSIQERLDAIAGYSH